MKFEVRKSGYMERDVEVKLAYETKEKLKKAFWLGLGLSSAVVWFSDVWKNDKNKKTTPQN